MVEGLVDAACRHYLLYGMLTEQQAMAQTHGADKKRAENILSQAGPNHIEPLGMVQVDRFGEWPGSGRCRMEVWS